MRGTVEEAVAAFAEALDPVTTRPLRIPAREIQEGDRLLYGAGMVNAVPFRVSTVLIDEALGLVNATGEQRIAVLHPDAHCVVEREVE